MENEQSPYLMDSNEIAHPTDMRPKKEAGFFGLSNFSIGMYIVLIVVIMYIVYTSFFKSENFTVTGELTDTAHDDTYLEDQIDILNKMQEKNLSS